MSCGVSSAGCFRTESRVPRQVHLGGRVSQALLPVQAVDSARRGAAAEAPTSVSQSGAGQVITAVELGGLLKLLGAARAEASVEELRAAFKTWNVLTQETNDALRRDSLHDMFNGAQALSYSAGAPTRAATRQIRPTTTKNKRCPRVPAPVRKQTSSARAHWLA